MSKKMMKPKGKQMKKDGAKSGTKPTHPSKNAFAAREKRLEGKPM